MSLGRKTLNEQADKCRQVRVGISSHPALETGNCIESTQSSVTMQKVVFSQRKVTRNQTTTKLSAAKKQTVAVGKCCWQSNEGDIEAVTLSVETQVIFEGSWRSALGESFRSRESGFREDYNFYKIFIFVIILLHKPLIENRLFRSSPRGLIFVCILAWPMFFECLCYD